ncbi:bifunctional anthranilate synthase component I family protein/class IV aminotransferase [Pseudoduganella ginsengisoli]|uniref:Aminodeoxychorismate synthase component I n=1 Tax=Pseudoduganella ginsengisoli TaxID=1462440 RepID=A0A6L6Q0A3_9BURK|nr:aminodeoxychorismate synthase component I [Pseudoduganella ginsengisoli]MTW02462.1 aminodeoxychorismate synthase component I [Pseudoduganella ginsengisoli]
MNHEVFALLDDASPDGLAQARSRLYTGHVATLRCDGHGGVTAWRAVLAEMEKHLAQGRHAVTLCAYELGAHILGMPSHPAADADAPTARVLVFECCELLAQAEVAAWLAARAGSEPSGIAAIEANVDEAQFTEAIARIRNYIAAGDTYQVNYTYRLRFDAYGSIFALYQRLRARQPVPYGALIAPDDGTAVLSLSPELFVRFADGELTARPMKGTAPAAADDEENARRAAALAQDTKNRAENLMIVDLLRNDIGRIAQTGTVKVPALFDVRRYSSVLQMTSTVQAQLKPQATLADIFDALYPCGSITGAPKRRTMEIIAELEPAPRGLYTGAIGWFEPAPAGETIGPFCMSVPIRTLSLQPPAHGVRRGELGVGAGIVYDSDPADEYAECKLKARFLTGLASEHELFETMYATREDGVRHLDRHLARLAASARYFGYPWDEAAARALAAQTCATFAPATPMRLRLALRAGHAASLSSGNASARAAPAPATDGALSVQHGVLAPLAAPVRVLLASDTTRADDVFLRHKSSVRARYDAAWRAAEAQGAFDMLFFNERGELTEGGRSNVFVHIQGRWLTPPLACGLLPGIMRSVLLDDPAWNAEEAVVTRAMLDQADEIVLCNALRGALPATIAA